MSYRRLLPFGCLALGAALAAYDALSTRVLVSASPASASPTDLDRDGDLLPDDVEWALLTHPGESDSDGDGIDDFLHVVSHGKPALVSGAPGSSSSGGSSGSGVAPVAAAEHEARTVVTIREENGVNVVWLHFLFRFAGGTIPSFSQFDPWIDVNQLTIPIGAALVQPGEFAISPPGPEGIFFRYSCPLATEQDVLSVGQSTIGLDVTMDGRSITSGVFLSKALDRLIAFTPISSNEGLMVPLSTQVLNDPFWSADRVCWMSVSVVSGTSAGSICQVTNALCRPGGSLRCPPTCTSSISNTLYVPDGLTTLTGGG